MSEEEDSLEWNEEVKVDMFDTRQLRKRGKGLSATGQGGRGR